MQRHDIAAAFRRAYNSQPNFMTPNLVGHGKRGRHLWELSHGRGMFDDDLYCVTVIDVTGERQHGLSKCFPTETAARAYIRNDFVEV